MRRFVTVFLFTILSKLLSQACATKTLYIGVLLPLEDNDRWVVRHSNVTCQLAVDHVNEHSSLLDGYKLELITNSSNCEIGLATYQLYQMLSSQRKLISLIAEGCTIVTQPLAKTTSRFDMLQFNFLSSSPSLDNREVYPLYYHLLPAETTLNYARIELLKKLGWRHAIIVFEAEEIFNLVANNIISLMNKNKLEYELYVLSAEMPSTLNDAIEKIATSNRRIIVGLFYEEVGRQMACRAYKKGMKNYVWLFTGWYDSRDWYARNVTANGTNCTEEEMRSALNGHFTFDYSQMASNMSVMLPTGKTRQEVVTEYRNKTNVDFQQYTAYGYDTVLAIALMLNKTIGKLKKNGSLHQIDNFTYHDVHLRETFQDVVENELSFEGLVGNINFKSSDHQGKSESTARIEVLYEKTLEDANISTLVAIYDNGSDVFSFDNISKIDWVGGKKPIAIFEDKNTYSSKTILYSIAALALLGIIFALTMLGFNIHFRSKKIIKLSSPRLNNLIAVGTVLVYAAIVFDGFNGQFYTFSDVSFVCCYFRTSLLAIGFSLSFGSMFVKTWRVSRIVKEAEAGRTESLKLTDTVLFAVVGVFIGIDILILSLWFSIDPYETGTESIRVSDEARYVRQGCVSINSTRWRYVLFGYKGLILGIGVFLAYETRKVCIVSLNDSRYIAMSVYNTVILCIIIFALSFVPDPGVRYALQSTAIIVAVTSVLGLVFFPKIYHLVSGRGDRKMKTFGRVATKRSSGVGDHTIARTIDLLALQGSNSRKNKVIKLLLENGNFEQKIIQRVKSTLGNDFLSISETNDDGSVSTETSIVTYFAGRKNSSVPVCSPSFSENGHVSFHDKGDFSCMNPAKESLEDDCNVLDESNKEK